MLKPGSTIGILGGGQLGRMLAISAAKLGYRCHIYAPEADSPAFEVCADYSCAAFEDEEALARFAAQVDVVTIEFENIPVNSLRFLEKLVHVNPSSSALAITQDRLSEKRFVDSLGVRVANFAVVDHVSDLLAGLAQVSSPAILKTRRSGYDGHGQIVVRHETEAAAALANLGNVSCILEGFVPFEREVSVIAARGARGDFAAFDICENQHVHHMLSSTRVPASIDEQLSLHAQEITKLIADALNYCGILTVEMFVTAEAGGRIYVNEIAPRVHNSGHWTLEGARTSQFEQHIRAICGLPLGGVTRFGRIEMRNLIGQECLSWLEILVDPRASLHLYGKREVRERRKMGHVTFIYP